MWGLLWGASGVLNAGVRGCMSARDLNANNVAVDVSTGRLVALDFDMSLVVGESMSDWTFVEPLLFRSLGVRVDREMSGRPYGGEYSDVYGMGTVLRWLLPEEVGGVARCVCGCGAGSEDGGFC